MIEASSSSTSNSTSPLSSPLAILNWLKSFVVGIWDAFFNNALIKREVMAMLRMKRVFWIVVIGVAGTAFIPLFNWPSQNQNLINPMRGRELYMACIMVQLIGGALILPAFTAGSFAGERERDTYELLHTTFLSPFAIILAKLLASVSFLLIYMIAAAPAVIFIYLQGGIEFSMVIDTYGMTIAGILSLAMVALTVSARCRKSLHALLRGFFWIIFWGGGVQLFIMLITMIIWEIGGARGGPPNWLMLFMCSSPLFAIGFSIMPAGITPPGLLTLTEIYYTYAAVIGGGHLIYLLWRVRSVAFQDARPGWWTKRKLEKAQAKVNREPVRIRRPLLVKAAMYLGNIGVPLFRNPVFMKEIRSEFFGKVWYLRLTIGIPILIFGLIMLIPSHYTDNFIGMGIVLLVVISFLLPGILSTAIPREVENGNLDLLRGTLTPLYKIFAGKMTGGLFGIFGVLLGSFSVMWFYSTLAVLFPNLHNHRWNQNHRVDFGTAFEIYFANFLILVLVFSVTIAFLVAVSFFFTSLCKRNLSALLSTYGSILACFMIIPVFFVIIIETTNNRGMWWLPEGLSPFSTWVEGISQFYRSVRWNNNNYDYSEKIPMFVTFFLFYGTMTSLFFAGGVSLMNYRHARDR